MIPSSGVFLRNFMMRLRSLTVYNVGQETSRAHAPTEYAISARHMLLTCSREPTHSRTGKLPASLSKSGLLGCL